MIIIIDKGHSQNGTPDPGAIGNGLTEAILTDKIGDSVINHLSGYDAEVLFSPRGELSDRASFANDKKADFFLSIHTNSGGGTGYESYTHLNASGETLRIAEAIHTHMASYYAQKGFKDRGLKRANFAVLRETNMPAVLIENLFIDNSTDAEFLRNNIESIGNEIAYALVVALGLKTKRSDAVVESWKLEVMKWAEDAKLITSGIHKPDEPADKAFVLAVMKNMTEVKK